jgi:hypothetical protein
MSTQFNGVSASTHFDEWELDKIFPDVDAAPSPGVAATDIIIIMTVR